MNLKVLIILIILAIPGVARAQTGNEINQTDRQGRKQGRWIKTYPDGNLQYEGTFKDNHPVGEFKRYYEDRTLKSVLTFSPDGRTADAVLYYPNGFIGSTGQYTDQKKEGKWKFYSPVNKGSLIMEEEYRENQRNGPSVKFYEDRTIAVKMNYVNDKREGEWTEYYPDGKLFLRSAYSTGKLNGKFETWFQNGKPEFSGFYKNNLREGNWKIYNEDGSLKYDINYNAGISDNPQMEKDVVHFFDSLDKIKDKANDPEKTGIL